MTTYNTGNPIGSADPKDLYDNAQNADEATNSLNKDYWDDRLGRKRLTWEGMTRLSNLGAAVAAAERAEAAADAASVAGEVFPSTTAGLAATASGEFFNVPASDAQDALILYENVGGTAVERKRYPSSLFDSLTSNRGKNYPLRSAVRGGVSSAPNAQMNDLLLDVKIINAEPGKVYRIAYQQNGAVLGGVSAYDWIVEEFDAATYETAPVRAIIMSYNDDQYGQQEQIDRSGGIQTIRLYPPLRPLMRIEITCDASRLPPAGTPVDAYANSSRPGYSYIVDPSCIDLPRAQPTQQATWDYSGVAWKYLPDESGTLLMVWRSGVWMYRVSFGPKGPNRLPDIRSIQRAALGDPDAATWNTIVDNASGGDWSGPYQIEAINNGDGDTSRQYTGGNHGKDGNVGGGASAKNLSFLVYADGAPASPGSEGFSGSIKILVTNDIMAYNTRSLDRYVLRESCRFDVFPGIVGLKKRPQALEDIRVYQDNGPQTFTVGFQSGSLIYYGKNNSRIAFTSSTNSGNKSTNPEVWAVVFQDAGNGQMAAWMDREFYAGDGRYVRNNWPYIRGGGASNTKFYHAAVVSEEGVSMLAGEAYEWRGGWAWQQATTVAPGFDSTLTFNREDGRSIAQADSNGITVEL